MIHQQASSSLLGLESCLHLHGLSLLHAQVSSTNYAKLCSFTPCKVSLFPSSGKCQCPVSLYMLVIHTYFSGRDVWWALGAMTRWSKYLTSSGHHLRSWISFSMHRRWCPSCIAIEGYRWHRKRNPSQVICSRAAPWLAGICWGRGPSWHPHRDSSQRSLDRRAGNI